jgi:hypothetical protein
MSSARTAEPGVRTPVSTISTAPPDAAECHCPGRCIRRRSASTTRVQPDPRPADFDASLLPAIPTAASPAYPSEHAATVGAAEAILSYLFRRTPPRSRAGPRTPDGHACWPGPTTPAMWPPDWNWADRSAAARGPSSKGPFGGSDLPAAVSSAVDQHGQRRAYGFGDDLHRWSPTLDRPWRSKQRCAGLPRQACQPSSRRPRTAAGRL